MNTTTPGNTPIERAETDPSPPIRDNASAEQTLQALRRELSAPIVPGELGSWARAVAEPLASVSEMLAARGGRDGLLEHILEVDPALSHRVEPLRERYETVRSELAELGRRVAELRGPVGPAADQRDPARHARAAALRDELLAWTLRAETLEGEARSWFSEAFYRDRGVGD